MKQILMIASLFLMSCGKEAVEVATGQIQKIESLNEIVLGQTDTIEVTFGGGTNGCAGADRLENKIVGDITTIKSFYRYPKKSQVCTTVIPVHQLKFTYKPTSKGTYTYKSFDSDITATTIVK